MQSHTLAAGLPATLARFDQENQLAPQQEQLEQKQVQSKQEFKNSNRSPIRITVSVIHTFSLLGVRPKGSTRDSVCKMGQVNAWPFIFNPGDPASEYRMLRTSHYDGLEIGRTECLYPQERARIHKQAGVMRKTFYCFAVVATFAIFEQAHAASVFELTGAETSALSRDGRVQGRTIALKMSGPQVMSADRLEAPLAPGIRISIQRKKTTTEFSRPIWIGTIQDDPFGRVVIATNPNDDRDIAMEIQTGGRSYTVLKTASGEAIVENQSLTSNDIFTDPEGTIVRPRAAVTTKSSDNFIDVMLAYSDDALAQNPNIETVLVVRMASVNEILNDSCAAFRYRVVHIEPVVYAETGNFLTDIGCLYSWLDGCLDNLHTLRDTHGADLIQLALYQNSACGIARTNAIGNFDTVNAVSVVGILCGADTMAHEFAHNLGIMHDRYQFGLTLSETSALYGSGFGFVDLKNKLYTVMSYPDHCDDLGISCSRSFQFSSPALVQNGTALGIPHLVDAVSQMNENFGYVANFRTAVTAHDAEIGTSCNAGSAAPEVNCFIATAAMGSYMDDDVIFLRQFRDSVLSRNSVGRQIIAWYYHYGPRLAYRLQASEAARSVVRPFIRMTAWVLRHAEMLFFFMLAVGLGLILRRRGMSFGSNLVLLLAVGLTFSESSKALESSQSFMSNWIGGNPALRLEVPARHQAAVEYVQGKEEIGGEFNKTEVERQHLLVTLGTYGADAFFDASIAALGNESEKTEQDSLGSVEEKGKWQSYSIRTGFRTSSLGLWGLGYSAQKQTNDTESIDQSRISLGNKFAFGTVQLSGSIFFVQESGSELASSKWIEEKLAIGYLEGDSNPRFLFEYAVFRRPAVLRRELGKLTAHGEFWSHQVTVEYRSQGGWVENVAAYAGFDKVFPLDNFRDLQEQWKVGLRAGVIVFTTGEATFGFEQNLPKNASMPDQTVVVAGLSYHIL